MAFSRKPALRLNRTVACFLIAGIVALFLAGVAFRSYATAQGVPLLGIDAIVFLPQTIPFRERGELTNKIASTAAEIDRSGQGRMLYHGFLYPMLVSVLMWRSDYLALAGSLAIIHATATLLVGVLLLNFAQLWRWRLTARRLLLLVLLAAACANYTQGTLGRAEPLAAIVLMLGVIGASRVSTAWHRWIAALAIGLLAAIDPIIALFAGLIYAGYAAWQFRAPKAVLQIFSTAALALGVFALCLLWYPYSFAEWFDGSLRLSRSAIEKTAGLSQWRNFIADYTTRGSTWMMAFTVPLVAWSALRISLRREPASPTLLCAFIILSGAALVRFVFYVPWANYNLLPLMPLGFLAVFHELGDDIERSPERFPASFPPIAIAILLLASLGFAGDLWERAHTFRFGFTLPEARRRFAELHRQQPGAVIGLHKNLFTLTEDYSAIVFGMPPVIPERADLWIQAQAFTRQQQPSRIAGFRLWQNYFNPQRNSFFGIPLWRMDRGCGFAVYRRERSALP